ncbi:hypothetical protein XA68_11440 [Ophiocordyceps unilateralis]|uniref:Uncharacterized protein n=1 Tax=Ophiocordyceps unilateralis TaxID=268505 RepID=A0A2A9PNS9_OPHUN|nr:hypothetical protein XA68_11440 [Ophiocordyceps unilateralis]
MAGQTAPSPIAIVGMGLRLPGGISTPNEFWDLLVNKKDGRCRVPSDRFNINGFHGEAAHRQKVASDHGYFLDDNLKVFDSSFSSASRSDLETLDPQQKLLVEVAWECLESAGQPGFQGSDTGVYVGVFGEDWHNILHKDRQDMGNGHSVASGDFGLANWLSYGLDLRGPSMTIRTACSASMSALHLACLALRNGDCQSAIVAGTSIIIEPSMTLDMTDQQVLSPTGSCKTFDAAADGFARGEAVNAILIKPLDAALKAGDPIRAIIRATAANSDGKTSSMGCPSKEAQEIMIRNAYRAAGIDDISETPFIECHGTGTPVGDPLEVAALAAAFGRRGTLIGSVKPNVGHGEGASGITSIIKAALSLENSIIPPNINFTTPNPRIPWDDYKFQVPLEPMPFPEGRPARISVNSFGIGGANAHAVMESAAAYGVSPQPRGHENRRSADYHSEDQRHGGETGKAVNDELKGTADSGRNELKRSSGNTCGSWESLGRRPSVLPISASTEKSLLRRIADIKEYLEAHPQSADDLVYTMGLRRSHLEFRSFSIVGDGGGGQALEFSPVERAGGRKAVFVFTGQGAQWEGMARSLLLAFPSFLEDIREMDAALQTMNEPPRWSIEGVLNSGLQGDEGCLNKAEFAQPICTAVQVALVNLLAKCGITPCAVVGHSSGEIAAAYAAGALTASEAVICASVRGQVTLFKPRDGLMAAVGLGRDAVLPHLVDGVMIACENSSKSVTLSGDPEAVQQTLKSMQEKKVETAVRMLPVNVAYHSHHMRDIGGVYEERMAPYIKQGREPKVPFFSSVYGKALPSETRLCPAYWRKNLESPVLFHGAVSSLLTSMQDVATVIEIGPHPALRGPLRQMLEERTCKRPPSYVATLVRGKECVNSMLETAGQLYVRGYGVDFSFLNPRGSTLADLPLYPWDHSMEYWTESRVSKAWRMKENPHHELLGDRCPESSTLEPVWRNVVHYSDVPWLSDHKVGTDVVFPLAGYMGIMGEAVRQTLGSKAFVLRSLTVKAALVLPETDAIEIRTTMRPTRLTDLTNSSSWHDMSISTFNGKIWTENCSGQAMAGEEETAKQRGLEPGDGYWRQISKGYFYDHMRQMGLRFGPRFQGLTDISTDPGRLVATATLRDDAAEHEACYAVHPTTLDCCLQLSVVAGCKGIARNIETLVLPVSIQRIAVSPGGEPNLVASAVTDSEGSTASVVVVAKDSRRPIVQLQGLRVTPFDTGDALGSRESLTFARLEWLPDINCLPAVDSLIQRGDSKRELFRLLEKLTSLAILQTLHTIESLNLTPTGHVAKQIAWMEKEKQTMIRGDGPLAFPEEQEWALMKPASLNQVAKSVLATLEATGDRTTTRVGRMIYDLAQPKTIEPIFRGTDPAEVIVADDRLTDFYDLQCMASPAELFQLLGQAKPTMKVLEIGAGTGGTTRDILDSLMSEDGIRLYEQFVFTDISPWFFNSARERFENRSGMVYQVLDITKSPAEQGFELESFDIVIASNVLHATPSLQETLRNVRSLLRPDGRLYLAELVQPLSWRYTHFLVGWLSGWWVGEADGRSDVPFITVERWDAELRAAGFSGVDSSVLDDDEPYYMCAHIVSRIAAAAAPEPEEVVILYKDQKHEFACRLADIWAREGHVVRWVQLGHHEELADAKHVVSAVDLEAPFFHDLLEPDYDAFIAFLSNLKGGVLWLTRPAQIACSDPRYGLVNGVARTVRVELSIDFWTAELQSPSETATTTAVLTIARKFFGRTPQSDGTDTEFAVHDGIVRIARCHWSSVAGALEPAEDDGCARQMVVDQYGVLDSLHWVRQQEPQTVQDGHVEVDIRCVGLNFLDIMVAMGLVPMPKDVLGVEAVGVVTRVGSAVDHVSVGDRVWVVHKGLFATKQVIPGSFVYCIPDGLSFEEAATMPIVYATVIYCLINLGQLRRGQSVLIHSAAGGVGQAAINICQMLGAEIYTTVGSESKIKYLIDNHGIPRERIFNSRHASFLDDLMQTTQGRGADLVLNSLSGDLLHASWQCVAKGGKMIEIGKRDILERGRLALDLFQNNRTFHGFDLVSLLRDHPEVFPEITRQFQTFLAKGHVKPIQPIHQFSAEKLPDAVRFMRSGDHIGKIVVTIPQDPTSIPSTKLADTSFLSDSPTYLLVGGLGGLGKGVTRWLVEKGARNFCFLSRSAGASDNDQHFFKELEAQGCRVAAVAGDVADRAHVQKAIQSAPTSIGGVLQLSMVLRDNAVFQMGYDDWKAPLEPKVKGTWNLHKALADTSLEFFILVSSLTGTVGQPGQVNYASANSFLDSFVQYRHSLGLPCSVVDLGPVEGIGYLSDKPYKTNVYKSFGADLVHEQNVVDAIQLAMKRSLPAKSEGSTSWWAPISNKSQLVVGLTSSKPLSDPTNRVAFKHDARVRLLYNMVSASEITLQSNDEGMGQLISQFEANPGLLTEPDAVSQISHEIGRILFRLLLLPEETLDTSMSLTSIGIDSLASIEIRNWWRRSLGSDKSVLEIMSAGTIEGLGRLAVQTLQKKHEGAR